MTLSMQSIYESPFTLIVEGAQSYSVGTGGLVLAFGRFSDHPDSGSISEKLIENQLHLEGSFKKQLSELIDTCGVRKAHVARLMQVSRQAIYDWLSDSDSTVSPQNQRRMKWIESLVDQLGDNAATEFGSALSIHLPNYDATLLEVISKAETEDKAIGNIVRHLAPQLAKRSRYARAADNVARRNERMLEIEAAHTPIAHHD